MNALLDKLLQKCLSKLKRSNRRIMFHLRRYKRPRISWPAAKTTPKPKPVRPVTLSDVDEFLFNNFRSLYQEEYELSKRHKLSGTVPFNSPSHSDHPISPAITRDPASSSLVAATEDEWEEVKEEERGDCIELLTCSNNPYETFQTSMGDIVEARVERNGNVDWGFMENMLFYFMNLNDKKYYVIILQAFVDLLVDLNMSSGRIPMSRLAWNQRTVGRHLRRN